MKQYNFDTKIERRGTDCFKWDALPGMYGRDDLLPMWVADNDWAAPDFVLNAMRQRLEHPVLGSPRATGRPSPPGWPGITTSTPPRTPSTSSPASWPASAMPCWR